MMMRDFAMFACGPGPEIFYVFIPIVYAGSFLCLLLGTVVFQFFAKSRPLSSPVLAGALTSIPGFLLGCGAALLSAHCGKQATFANFFPNPVPKIAALSIFLAPFGLAAIGTLLGFLVGFKAKRRRASTTCG